MNKRWGEEGIGTSDLICIQFLLDLFRIQIFVALLMWVFKDKIVIYNREIIYVNWFTFCYKHWLVCLATSILSLTQSPNVAWDYQLLGFVVSISAIVIWCFSLFLPWKPLRALDLVEMIALSPLSILPGEIPPEWDCQNSCLSIDSRNTGKALKEL